MIGMEVMSEEPSEVKVMLKKGIGLLDLECGGEGGVGVGRVGEGEVKNDSANDEASED